MAAAECIPVNVSTDKEVEELKKAAENGDHAVANGDSVENGCQKNGKHEDGPAGDNVPDASPSEENSNSADEPAAESTETTGDEECCEEEDPLGSEDIAVYDERMNGNSKKKAELVAEEECEETVKRPADDGESCEEPAKKFYTESGEVSSE